jgi:hypothetical protein
MTAGPALPCPHCRQVLRPEAWIDATSGVCGFCRTPFDFVGFPALTAAPTRAAPQAAVLAADSVCFFHPENRAEAICDSCGRLLCAVCAIPFSGQRICPSCIASSRKAGAPATVRSRTLYDNIALALALYPLIIWFFTLVTAPVALGFVIYGWNKPGSLVRGRGRGKLIAAGILALLEIAGWITFFVFLWLK